MSVLGNLVASHKPLIYMDESTFLSQDRKARSWLRMYEKPTELAFDNERFVVTVYGAIGSCLTEPVYMTAKSTNKVDFVKFLRLVKAKQRSPYTKPVLFYDQASAHTSGIGQTFLKEHFMPMRNVAHSCCFNAIEKVWQVAKCYFRKRLLLHPEALTMASFKQLVLWALADVSESAIRGILRSNTWYIRHMLTQKLN